MATTYFGVDVSVNNGTINWATMQTALANDNVANGSGGFVFIQAAAVTFGGGGLVTDGEFATNQAAARARNIRRGFYFFVRDDDAVARSGVTDANYFIGVIGALQAGEIVVLDVDLHGGYAGADDTYAFNFCSTVLSHYGSSLPTMLLYDSESQLTGLRWAATSGITYCWPAAYDGFGGTNWASYSIAAWSGKNYPGSGVSPSDYYFHQWTDGVIGGSNSGATYGCTSAHIDQDSFYSLNNTLADWDRFGYGGAPAPGTLTTATISNPSMTYVQPEKQTIIVPANDYDKVLYSNVLTTTVSAASWPQTISAPATNINQYAYAVGNFGAIVNGVDIGTNDFGVIDFGVSGYGQFPGNLPNTFIQPSVDASGNVSFFVTYTPGGSATINLTINYALLAYPFASNAPVPTSRVNQAFANVFPGGNPTVYSTYRRIALDSSVGTGASTVAHGQGSVPNVFFWVQDNGGTIEPQPSTWTNAGALSTSFGLAMDSTNVYIRVDAANNSTCWYRVYKDN